MNSIIKPAEFNLDNVSYSEPKSLSNGGKAVYVNFNNGPVVLQTQKMKCPFGMSKFDGDYPKYTLEMSFAGMDNNESLETFYNKMSSFDEKLVSDGVVNSMPWFKKKKMKEEVVSAFYTPQVKLSKDKETGEPNGKYPPTLKVKLPWRDGKFTCDVYDAKKERVDADLSEVLTKGTTVQALIQCVGLWFAGGKYGCSWKIVQLKVTKQSAISGYAFIADSDDDADADAVDDADQENLVEDSGSDLEEEDSD